MSAPDVRPFSSVLRKTYRVDYELRPYTWEPNTRPPITPIALRRRGA